MRNQWSSGAWGVLAAVVDPSAFAGAALVFLNYRPAFLKQDPMLDHTAGIFCTFPTFPEVPLAGFIDQVLGTALLLFLVMALTDENNLQAPAWLSPQVNVHCARSSGRRTK